MLIIYHGKCIDGFTAAWAAWRQFGDRAEYVPALHGEAPPDVTDRKVYIVDFSYPRPVLEEMWGKASFLAVFDHHKTAQADLAGLTYCAFDMNRSGAGLTWDHIVSSARCPLVNYVEDRDLWRFALPFSKEVNALIGSERQDFRAWDALDERLRNDFDGCVRTGAALLRQVERYVEEMAQQARMVDFAGHTVPIVNAPYINTSELVGKLAETAPFAVGWYQRGDGKYAYSLRSRGDFDVSELAKTFGGGGHRNAAGFTSDTRVHE